jgi:hypothetical protein
MELDVALQIHAHDDYSAEYSSAIASLADIVRFPDTARLGERIDGEVIVRELSRTVPSSPLERAASELGKVRLAPDIANEGRAGDGVTDAQRAAASERARSSNDVT